MALSSSDSLATSQSVALVNAPVLRLPMFLLAPLSYIWCRGPHARRIEARAQARAPFHTLSYGSKVGAVPGSAPRRPARTEYEHLGSQKSQYSIPGYDFRREASTRTALRGSPGAWLQRSEPAPSRPPPSPASRVRLPRVAHLHWRVALQRGPSLPSSPRYPRARRPGVCRPPTALYLSLGEPVPRPLWSRLSLSTAPPLPVSTPTSRPP